MGIGVHSAIHLFKLAKKRELSGTLLTLGVQDTHLKRAKLKMLAKQYDVAPPPKEWKPELNTEKRKFATHQYLSGASFWKFMGFEDVDTMDVDEFESASVIFDLNEPSIPEELKEKYDVIFDGGTLEHVFHLPNALSNLHEMLTPNGLIIHQNPSSPHIDHGFYMFSPTFFEDYYETNGYRRVDFQMILYPMNSERDPSWFMDYAPGAFDGVSHGGFSPEGMNLLIACAFEKTGTSTAGIVPQQSMYKKAWQESALENWPGRKPSQENAGETDQSENG